MRTTPVDVIDASVPSSLAVVSISANRSSWSRATLSSSACVGVTTLANWRACHSSSSSTATSASSRPLSGRSPSIAEITPRVKLLPVGLLKTRLPCARRIAASILVVVVFPFVPVTTTMPSVRPESACARNCGSIRSATRPGIAEPPPRTRAAARAVFPATIAAVVLSTPQTLRCRRATPGYAWGVTTTPALRDLGDEDFVQLTTFRRVDACGWSAR